MGEILLAIYLGGVLTNLLFVCFAEVDEYSEIHVRDKGELAFLAGIVLTSQLFWLGGIIFRVLEKKGVINIE